ncbi:hypothetical protein [Vibrio cionasavignyae]|uniref:hypothetical protein n=1 Tax=Vibrio cionasavignyae TaxID=2910252 RepID=UPI003D13BF1D
MNTAKQYRSYASAQKTSMSVGSINIIVLRHEALTKQVGSSAANKVATLVSSNVLWNLKDDFVSTIYLRSKLQSTKLRELLKAQRNRNETGDRNVSGLRAQIRTAMSKRLSEETENGGEV